MVALMELSSHEPMLMMLSAATAPSSGVVLNSWLVTGAQLPLISPVNAIIYTLHLSLRLFLLLTETLHQSHLISLRMLW
ncbi:hypothetical protein BO94DRAFT_40510 [Aspergillus sclerotioniger CBS 115572]|uniref:Uncharacterized protein n=1 Tax=Aspergillus sclerotioniger CBS 115572 TaxID=1450535 RepID=A0A317WUR1_9EURO|nr:hypothetical protein BO94DRAFT_40510 [Aspergillus sclerotioniger CBS 115572]PWY89551.1 hypothetical protein BO94DRAFT_40510 [Aspergillus sclerotioniger CBS 115572]